MANKKVNNSNSGKNTGRKASSGKKTSSASGRVSSGSKGKASSGSKGKTSAAGNKNSSSRKMAANTRTREKTEDYYYEEERTNPMLYYEIFLWIMLAFSILLFISFMGIGGVIGEAVSSFFFGCFGVLAYLLPFLLFFLTAFLISNRTSHIAKIKAAGAGGLYLALCGILELLLLGYHSGHDLMEYYEAAAKYKTGGGLIGGMLVNLFCPAIGVAGAYIMLFIMAIICIVLITQRSIFEGVRKQSSRMYHSAREGQAKRREQAQILKESREYIQQDTNYEELPVHFSVLPKEPRMNNRITGVTRDTDLSGLPRIPSDEIQEVLPGPHENFSFFQSLEEEHAKMKQPAQRKKNSGSAELKQEEPEANTIPEEDMPDLGPIHIERAGIRPGETAKEDSFSQEDPVRNDALDADAEETVPNEEVSVPEAGSKEEPVRRAKKPHASEAEIQEGIQDVEQEIEKTAAAVKPQYIFPPLDLLKKPARSRSGNTDGELMETARKLQQTLHTFGVNVKITNVSCGPSVTRYELMPEMGVKVSKIVNLADDIKLNLAASDIRIEAPIPGKAAVGIEVPNKESSGVLLRELLEAPEFKNHPSNLAYAVGKDIGGNIIVSDIAKMPHLLIAGATGSGKSVFINTLIMSIIFKASPDDVKLIMIDPKVVELSVYNGIPHLFIPVVTDPKKAAGALNWGVAEMTDRYQKFAEMGVRDLKGYNAKIETIKDIEDENKPEKLPQIVIIVDELADLMMVASGEVEDAICRLAQLARAAGIHLVIATQRPSVDVITGLIKANMPSRIAFSVSSGVDSRTILDMNGAEKLLGNGDMLFAPQTYKKPARVQGAFVSDKEVSDVVDFLKEKNTTAQYSEKMEAQIAQVQKSAMAAGGGDVDELFAEAGKFIIEKDKASIGMLQRWFKIGFNRAARIMDQLSEAGVVGPEEGTKPRKVLMSMEQFENYLEEN